MQQFGTKRRGQSFCIISTVLKQSPKQAQELSDAFPAQGPILFPIKATVANI